LKKSISDLGYLSHFQECFGIVFQKWFWFPKRPPCSGTVEGQSLLILRNAFGKSAITFHPLSRFCRNIACFKGNWFRSQKIFWVFGFTVFSCNDVITKLKILITLIGAPELFRHIWHNLGMARHYLWVLLKFWSFSEFGRKKLEMDIFTWDC
jgi:hypothetical protein